MIAGAPDNARVSHFRGTPPSNAPGNGNAGRFHSTPPSNTSAGHGRQDGTTLWNVSDKGVCEVPETQTGQGSRGEKILSLTVTRVRRLGVLSEHLPSQPPPATTTNHNRYCMTSMPEMSSSTARHCGPSPTQTSPAGTNSDTGATPSTVASTPRAPSQIELTGYNSASTQQKQPQSKSLDCYNLPSTTTTNNHQKPPTTTNNHHQPPPTSSPASGEVPDKRPVLVSCTRIDDLCTRNARKMAHKQRLLLRDTAEAHLSDRHGPLLILEADGKTIACVGYDWLRVCGYIGDTPEDFIGRSIVDVMTSKLPAHLSQLEENGRLFTEFFRYYGPGSMHKLQDPDKLFIFHFLQFLGRTAPHRLVCLTEHLFGMTVQHPKSGNPTVYYVGVISNVEQMSLVRVHPSLKLCAPGCPIQVTYDTPTLRIRKTKYLEDAPAKTSTRETRQLVGDAPAQISTRETCQSLEDAPAKTSTRETRQLVGDALGQISTRETRQLVGDAPAQISKRETCQGMPAICTESRAAMDALCQDFSRFWEDLDRQF